MNIRYRNVKNRSRLKDIIIANIQNNIREYLIITVIFLIGIVVGVIFINGTSEEQASEIGNYINDFITNLKDNGNVNDLLLLKDSIGKNLLLAILLWFMGSTVIGISVVYLIICFRGFCLGYTISSIILTIRYSVKEFCSYFLQFSYKIFYLYHALLHLLLVE